MLPEFTVVVLALARMSYSFGALDPAPDLKQAIKFFFFLEFRNDDNGPDYVLPNGLPSFFYIQSEKPVQAYFGDRETPVLMQNGFYIGYCDTVIKFTHDYARIAGAVFYPMYFNIILGTRLIDILNQFVRVEEPSMLGQVKFFIGQNVEACAKAFQLFEQYLLHRLNSHPLRDDFSKIYARLLAPGGYHLRVEELAESLGYSARNLNSVFRQHFGMSPKQFIKMVKFNQALKYIYDADDQKSIASIAYEVGYHDHSHFIRDFKSICGKTPKELVGDSAALANKFILF